MRRIWRKKVTDREAEIDISTTRGPALRYEKGTSVRGFLRSTLWNEKKKVWQKARQLIAPTVDSGQEKKNVTVPYPHAGGEIQREIKSKWGKKRETSSILFGP